MKSTYVNRKLEWLVYYSPIFCALLIVLFVQLLELALLLQKYDLFTGGFLQPYSFTTFPQQLGFLAISTFFDAFTFVVLFGIIWLLAARALGKKGILLVFNYLYISCAVFAVWIAIKYKVLTYFSDAIDFTLAKNLAGGSFAEALSYVANESIFILVILLIIIGAYSILVRLLKPYQHIDHCLERVKVKTIVIFLVASTLLVAPTIYFVNMDGKLRYGLVKKTSFVLATDFFDAISDFDNDGFGVFNYPIDMDPFNASIYPFAIDIPGNGIDEDGLAGDSHELAVDHDLMAATSLELKENIVFIVLESARADILGSVVDGKAVTPTLHQLVKQGVSVPHVYSHTGYTTSSIKAIFNRTILGAGEKINILNELEDRGYSLNFISGQDESFGAINSDVGMDKPGRFLFDARSALEDRVYASTDPGSLRLSEDRVVKAVNDRLDKIEVDSPFFMYINFQAAHFPYSHPKMPANLVSKFIPREKILPENLVWLKNTYLNAINVADNAIGQVVETLKQRGLWEKTILVVTGDHGESLFDDGFLGHGHAINDEQTKIPLVVNRAFSDPEKAIGQSDILSWVISSTTQKGAKEIWSDSDDFVFQIVGPLSRPKMIGFVNGRGERIIYDFRSASFYESTYKKWFYFDGNMPVDVEKKYGNLINYWEFLKRKKQNFSTLGSSFD